MNGEHSVFQIRIAGDVVVVICACGWESDPLPSETEARAQHDAHQGV